MARSGAVSALVSLAERVGAEVHGDVLPAQVNFPNQHPQFSGRMGRDQAAVGALLADADAVVMVGAEIFEEVWFADADPFPARATRIERPKALPDWRWHSLQWQA